MSTARSCRNVVFVSVLGAATLIGCQAPQPRSAPPPVPTDSSPALLDYIAEQPYLTAEAAYRAIYILWKGQVFHGDFSALTDELRTGRIIAPHWKHQPERVLDRSAVGYMVCRAAGIRTGVNWQLTGAGRYAWRELNYLGIASPPSEYGYVSGGQFVGILARAEDYMHRRRTVEPPGQLGPEPR